MNHLAVEDGYTQHKFLSQINSSSSVNFAAYNCRQNRGKSNKPKQPNQYNRYNLYNNTANAANDLWIHPGQSEYRYGHTQY